jgi:Flp pilus assembly protein TadD
MIRGILATALVLLVPAEGLADRALPSYEAYGIRRTVGTAIDAWSRGQVHVAETAATEAVALAPENLEAWRIVALSRLALGRVDAAWEAHEPLSRLGNDDVEACLLRGRLAVEAGQSGAAGAAYRRVREVAPDDPRHELGHALIAARLHRDYETMARHLRAAHALDSSEPDPALALRAAWAPLADDPQFLQHLQRILEVD